MRSLSCGLFYILFLICAAGCGEEREGGGTNANSFTLDYRAGASALLDLQVKADLRFSGKRRGVPSTLASVGVLICSEKC